MLSSLNQCYGSDICLVVNAVIGVFAVIGVVGVISVIAPIGVIAVIGVIYVQYWQSDSDGQIYFPMVQMDPSDKRIFGRRSIFPMENK